MSDHEDLLHLRSAFQIMHPHHYFASGKLLFFGEYLVLRGARCLAAPLKLGQRLEVTAHAAPGLLWQSFEGTDCWLEVQFSEDLHIRHTTDEAKAKVLQQLLSLIRDKNNSQRFNHLCFRTYLDFNREFGFGSSATLISLLSQWSCVDPYFLLEKSFGGSGYDIATATASEPLVYSMAHKVEKFCFLPPTFTDHLLFVYLGQKQTSSREILSFKNKITTPEDIADMNRIVDAAAMADTLEGWEALMQESEKLMSRILGQPTVKETYFADYPCAVKSLGAWGGDFVMVTCRDQGRARNYFKQKEKQPVFTYQELVQQRYDVPC